MVPIQYKLVFGTDIEKISQYVGQKAGECVRFGLELLKLDQFFYKVKM